LKLRVWNVINPPGPGIEYEVASLEEGARLINRLAKAQLKQSWIESNAFGLDVFNESDGEWETWYDDEGEDIDKLCDELWESAE
jgi:hypothetical protein